MGKLCPGIDPYRSCREDRDLPPFIVCQVQDHLHADEKGVRGKGKGGKIFFLSLDSNRLIPSSRNAGERNKLFLAGGLQRWARVFSLSRAIVIILQTNTTCQVLQKTYDRETINQIDFFTIDQFLLLPQALSGSYVGVSFRFPNSKLRKRPVSDLGQSVNLHEFEQEALFQARKT